MKPICFDCKRFCRPKKNGFTFLEGMPVDNARPGNAEPEKWRPYKLWSGDLWECPGCSHRIIAGTGSGPMAVHHEPEFDDMVQRHRVNYQVNDC